MNRNYAPVLVLLAGILWGTLGFFSRHLTAAGFGPFEITFVRVSISLLATAIPVVLFARELLYVRLRDLWCFLGTGIVSVLLFSVWHPEHSLFWQRFLHYRTNSKSVQPN